MRTILKNKNGITTTENFGYVISGISDIETKKTIIAVMYGIHFYEIFEMKNTDIMDYDIICNLESRGKISDLDTALLNVHVALSLFTN